MTAPAPSPGPAKRSRRLYVYWGIALALLLTLGLLCWLVVVPVLRAREVLIGSGIVTRIPDGSPVNYGDSEIIRRLGGAEDSARSIGLYIWAAGLLRPGVDDIESDYRWAGVSVLESCGEPGWRVLESLHDDYDPLVRQRAAQALKKIREKEKTP